VITVRTVADTKRIQRALAGNRAPVVVLGSGFTGSEVAATLRSIGRDVTIVSRSGPLMGNLLGEELGGYLTDLHVRRGVNVESETTIADWAPGTRGIVVRLTNGRMIDAACVVVAVGSVPAVRWLRDSGVPVDDGVVCDPTCHVAGFDDMVAAGDVASWPNLRFDTRPRRTEHWTNAIEMGRAAAENLLAGRSAATPFMPVPRFWSEQHGLHIQAAGIPVLGAERVRQPGASLGRSVTHYLHDGRLMGVVGLDSAASVLAYADDLSRLAPLARSASQAVAGTGRRRSFLESIRSA
jgi:NADPH-dependent 2,4-dienoyl-CoA reductase/sulfur reductase-like enzyme